MVIKRMRTLSIQINWTNTDAIWDNMCIPNGKIFEKLSIYLKG